MSNQTAICHTLKEKVNFDLQQNEYPSFLYNAFQPVNMLKTDDMKQNCFDYQQLFPLLSVCYHNKIDLAQLMLTQYEQSNLTFKQYMARSSLFDEIGNNTNVRKMFTNYIISHTKYVYKPLPINALPSTVQPFNDNIDIILQYMIQINNIIEHNIIQTCPAQLDVYIVPSTAKHDLESVRAKGIVYSKPFARKNNYNNRSGLDDLYSLFCTKKAKKLMNRINGCENRLVLLIVRGNENDTRNDILYLLSQSISGDLRQKRYEYNEVLWNINSKQNIILNNKSTLSIDGLFNVSYHFHADNICRMYMYYNGFGERVFKQSIVKKWPILFVNGKNQISNAILNQLNGEKSVINDFTQNDTKCLEIGQYLFGVKLDRKTYKNDANKKPFLHIPKDMLKNGIPQIREFDHTQHSLYYYLMWTSKMQVIDDQFMHYTLRNKGVREIGIFNCELHEQHSNNILFVVCVLNDTNDSMQWTMDSMMTSYDIYNTYGIHFIDLPIGSRHIHNQFETEISKNNINLKSDFVPIRNWNAVDMIPCTKTSKSPKFARNLNPYNLNQLVTDSIDAILSNTNNLSLIPILRIDIVNEIIHCESLIPIKLCVANKQKWMAISYEIVRNKIVIKSLYSDCSDILNKAILVNANVFNAYKYLKGEEILLNNDTLNIHLASNQAWIINSLQQQLNESLKRETLLMGMLKQKDQQIINANVTNNICLPAYFCYS